MSREADVKILKLEEQMKEMQFQMSQVMSAIAAMVEVDNMNAVVEGDEAPKAVSNGQIKKQKAHR